MYRKFSYLLIIILGLAVYLLVNKGIPGNIDSSSLLIAGPFDGKITAFEISHERSSYATLVALDETGNTILSPGLAYMAAPDAGYIDNKYYSFFPPGLAIASWPIYKLGQMFDYSLAAAYFMEAIYGVLALIVLFKICNQIFRFPAWLSLFIVFSTGFASTFLNFSITFYQHVPSTFLLLLAYYSAWKYGRDGSWGWASLCWICYGVASFFDYPNLIIFSPVILYLIYNGISLSKDQNRVKLGIKNSLVISSLFLLLLGGAHMYYNYSNYGSPIRFSNSLPNYNPRHDATNINELDANDLGKLADQKSAISYALKETNLIHGFSALIFDINKSLLLHMPIFILLIFGVYTIRKKINMEISIIFLIIGVNVLLYSSFTDPWGGWGYGPRYLVTSMPFINILIGFWLVNDNIYKRLLVLPFVIYSSGVALMGALTRNILLPNVQIYPDSYHLPHKFWDLFYYLKLNQNGSLIYNEFLANKISLTEFLLILWGFIGLVFVIVLFILPYTKYGNKSQENLDR